MKIDQDFQKLVTSKDKIFYVLHLPHFKSVLVAEDLGTKYRLNTIPKSHIELYKNIAVQSSRDGFKETIKKLSEEHQLWLLIHKFLYDHVYPDEDKRIVGKIRYDQLY